MNLTRESYNRTPSRAPLKTAYLLLLVMASLSFSQHSADAKCISFNSTGICQTCREGYVKDPTGNDSASLLISGEGQYSIIRVPLDGLNTTHHLENKSSAFSIDYSFQAESIFWYNYTDRKLYAGSIIEGSKKSVVNNDPVAVIRGISYDWIYDNIYWTDLNKDEICVSNKNGTLKKVLFNERPNCCSALFSIVVNPLNGWMFWADYGRGKQRIERAAMDGSRREVILSTDISQPYALTIDFDENRLYFTQDNPASISSSNFDGSDRKLILAAGHSQFITRSFGSITTFEDSIYWTVTPASNYIYKANKFDGSNLVVAYESTWPSSLNTVKVYASSNQPSSENYCKNRTQRCSHFCFPVPAAAANDSISTACACPDGLSLSPDGINCIL